MIIKIIITIIFVSSLAFAGTEKPLWVSNPPSCPGDVCVIGIGDAANANDAQNEAKGRGWIELVEQVLGVDGTATVTEESDAQTSSYKRQAEMSTAIVQFKTLITVDKHIEHLDSGEYRCFLLLKLPTDEVSRLRKLAATQGAGHLLNRLQIESEPTGAQVLLDGDTIGITPLNMLVPAKGYRLQLKLKGYKPVEKFVVMNIGKDHSLSFPLERSTGTLIIHAEPSNSSIYLDGVYLGSEPGTNHSVATGHHEIRVQAEGYKPEVRSAHVRENKDYKLEILLALEPIKQDPPPPEKQPSSWDSKAKRLVNQGDWPELVTLGRLWLAESPDSANANFYAGYGFLKLSRTESALPLLERSNSLGSNTVVLAALCAAKNQARLYSKAIDYCNQALEKDLKNDGAYTEIARAYQGRGEHIKAYDNMIIAISLNRGYQTELRKLCRTEIHLHQHEQCARINYPSIYP